ncbi:MAG: hypothetical protein ABIP71_07760 [Verrucomicrobiota bacterium]
MTRKPAGEFAIKPTIEVSHLVVTQIVESISQTKTILPPPSASFDWSVIESKDFSVYADNLRGIGCPEQTVRDILTAEINDLFVHRRQDLFRPLQNQFWDLMAQGGENKLIPKEIEEKLDALDEAKQTLIKKIFRAALPEEKNLYPGEYAAMMAGSLSPEKVQQFRIISEKFDKLREKIQSSDLPEAEKKKQQALLSEQSVAEQKGILSPEEMDEFKLRKSAFAQARGNLLGFNASEEELRAMARLTMNEKPVPKDPQSPDYEAKLAEQRVDKEEIDKQMKALLGKNRFEEYERSKDSNFQNLIQLGRRYDLSLQTISEVYELTRSIHKQVSEFKKSNAASEKRDEALETIRQQTERAMIAKLGARAAETYRRNFNNWDEIPDQ